MSPPGLLVRTASAADTEAIAGLDGELGYPSAAPQVRRRLRLLDVYPAAGRRTVKDQRVYGYPL